MKEPEKIKKEAEKVKKTLFWLVAFLTSIYLGAQWYSFYYHLENVSHQFTIFASAAIFGYAVLKEILRWKKKVITRFWGEIFFHCSIGSYVLMEFLSWKLPTRFPEVPIDMFQFALSVFTYWLTTKISWVFHSCGENGNCYEKKM